MPRRVSRVGLIAMTTLAAAVMHAAADDQTPTGGAMSQDSFYTLATETLAGQPATLSKYAGQVTLVVNVASQCGYTPQYKGLEALHKRLAARGFAVLGFPSNDFGGQEPGSPAEIQTFCQRNYGVTFPLFAKQSTKPGPEQSPVYAWLGRSGHLPNWNFCKYVIGKDGKVAAYFPSKVAPEARELLDAIEAALAR